MSTGKNDNGKEVQPRTKLREAREMLDLTLMEAADLVTQNDENDFRMSHQQVHNYEKGEGTYSGKKIAALCQAYVKYADDHDYASDQLHESILCPGEFLPPKKPSDGSVGL